MKRKNILAEMQVAPLVFDGAMGTMIYASGVFINRCFDELCLSNPDLIASIHRRYIEAGADVIETNSFGANRILLGNFGLADDTVRINMAAARIARECAEDKVIVGGSVGPCLHADQTLGDTNRELVRAAFTESIEALAEGGVDFILLETFSHPDELLLAAEAAKKTELPVMASFAVGPDGVNPLGTPAEEIVKRLHDSEHVDIIGMNCGTGPAQLYATAEKALPLTDKPFVLMPNAGSPQEVEGRTLYLATPEYFTTYARFFIQLGARGVGGCCGTTPDHIRDMAKAVKKLSGVKRFIEIKAPEKKTAKVEPLPLRERSRWGAALAAGKRVSSVEILPPRSSDLSGMLDRVRKCAAAGVDAINIPDGPRASARISPMITALSIKQEIGLEPVIHYCCRDRNLIGMQSDILGAQAVGLVNFLIITGDPPKLGDYPDVTGVFDVDSIGLTRVVANLNRGIDIGGNPIRPQTSIVIGVGANPCAVHFEKEIERYRKKIEAGAEFAITQPVFDADALFRFIDATEKFPRTIPIVAGVWPLTSYKNAEFMKNEVPGVEVPDEILSRMSRCRTKEDGIKTGCEIAREIRDRIADAVNGFQVSAPFGKVELALNVLAT